MADYKPVPVAVALAIAQNFDKSQVVILSYDPVHELTHTTTYGVSAFDKEQAAAAGVVCTEAIGCDLSKKIEDEDFHRDYDPARLKEALEVLVAVDEVLCRFLSVHVTPGDQVVRKIRDRVKALVAPSPQSGAAPCP